MLDTIALSPTPIHGHAEAAQGRTKARDRWNRMYVRYTVYLLSTNLAQPATAKHLYPSHKYQDVCTQIVSRPLRKGYYEKLHQSVYAVEGFPSRHIVRKHLPTT